MATNQSSAAQERQLILMERMNRRLDSILENQKKLEETGRNQQQPSVREHEVKERTCQARTSYEEQTSLKKPRIQCGNP